MTMKGDSLRMGGGNGEREIGLETEIEIE